MSFIYKCFISFFIGVLINDLTESNTSLKFLEQTILTNHSSFQFDLRLENFVILIALTILSIIFIFFKNSKLIKTLIFKIIELEIILFSFFKGLNMSQDENIFSNKNLILIIGCILLILLKIFSCKQVLGNEESKKIIYNSRELDLKKLNSYLKNSNIVGIDSEWGQGKSYFVDYWKEKEKLTNVLISILNISEKDAFKFILKQLDKQLLKEGNIETNSRILKEFLSNQNFLGINLNGIFSSKTYKEALNDYKRYLENRKEPLYIIFDDLDRVKEKEILIKILNFGDELQSNKLKILYLYDQKKLNALGLDREYIEKFIPITLNLTKLNFFDILDLKLEELEMNISKNEFDFLKIDFFEKIQSFEELKINSTPRNVEIFLKEVNSILIIKEKFKDIKNREIIAMIFFKIFYFENVYLNLKRLLEINWRNNNVLENLNKIKFVFNKDKNNSSVLKQPIIETLGYIFMPKGAKDNEWNQKVKKNLNILYSLESIENLTTYEKAYKYIHELLENFEISLEEKSKRYIKINEVFNLKFQSETFHGKEFLLIDWFCRESKIDEKQKLLEIILFNTKITSTMILSLSSEYILNNINFRKIIFNNLKNKDISELNKLYLKEFIVQYFKSINNYNILENFDKIEKEEVKLAIKSTKELLKDLKSIQVKIFKEEYESLDELELFFVKLLNNSTDSKVEVSLSKSKIIENIVKSLQENYLSKDEQLQRINYLVTNNEIDEYFVESILGELSKIENHIC